MTLLAANPILAVIFFIAILVFVHETGHFVVGKMCGIGVEIYSIGFGPKIFGFSHQGTEYQLCLLPLGGFVKFAGGLRSEEVPERFKGKEMYRASPLARAATILAGPAANLLLAASIYTIHALQGIEHPPAIIGMVMPKGPADLAGIEAGDKITSIDGQAIHSWEDLRGIVAGAPGQELKMGILREGQAMVVNLTPTKHKEPNLFGKMVTHGRIGISYGLVPAILSPLPGGDAPKSVSPGDQVLRFAFSNLSHPRLEEFRDIKSWPELMEGFDEAFQNKVDSIVLETKKAPMEEAGSNGPEAVKRILVDTKNWYQVDNLHKIRSLNGAVSRRHLLAKLLGLGDAQTTVSIVKEPLVGHIVPGDRIVSVEGNEVSSIFSLIDIFKTNKQKSLKMEVLRQGTVMEIEVPLKPVEVQKASGKDIYFQFNANFWGKTEAPPPYIEQYSNPFYAFWYGIKETGKQSAGIVKAIAGLITGQLPLKALGGPMLIAKVAGDAAEAGWLAFFSTMALISVNLGMLNLFPIPALDGGQLLLVAAEALRRRPLSEMAMENFQRVGFVMVMALVVLATYNDLSRFWASMLRGVSGMFE